MASRPIILAADDDSVTRTMLGRAIEASGWTPRLVSSGTEALAALVEPDAPTVAILDWVMPGLDGVEVCRRLREQPQEVSPYVIMATMCDRTIEVTVGLDAGADDYMTKPVDSSELQARVRVGLRTVALQQTLVDRVTELRDALSHVKELRGLLPICAYCKSIRDDRNYWQSLEAYLSQHTDVTLSHGFCPECIRTRFEPELEALERTRLNAQKTR